MITIEVKGLDELVQKLGELNTKSVLNTGIEKIIMTFWGLVIPETPIDKGFLRNSYQKKTGDLWGRLINTREYGLYVHEGHKTRGGGSFVKGNPFITRTLDKNEAMPEKIMNKEVQKMLNSLRS